MGLMNMHRIAMAAVLLVVAGALPSWSQTSVRIHVDASLRRLSPSQTGHAWFLTGGFSPNLIEVEQSQQVTLELKSVEGLHSLAIPEYGVVSAEVGTGQTTTVTFQAERVGEFAIECHSDCGGLHRRMTGTMVVNPGPAASP